ncbi:c2 domain-containing protein [Phthorimaea operculella]|nr:c2 domain-containing protein [Phthorimaea operculella]
MGKSESDKKVSKKNEDAICLNCFSAEDLKDPDPDPVPLSKIRKEHREKLKLYSFLASEISRPRAVPLKQRVSEPYAIGKKIDEKITKDPKFTKYAPKEVITENKAMYIEHNIQKRDVDYSSVSDSTSVSNVYEVKGSVKQEDNALQSKFNDSSSDQISLAESVNESTDVIRNSITVVNQKVSQDPQELKCSGKNSDNTIEINNENKTEVRSITSKSAALLLGKSKAKRQIAEDAYLPKNLQQELNEADIVQSSECIPKNIDSPVNKKIKPEKIKKSSKLFKMFSKSKSSKENNKNPTSKTIFESDEVISVDSNVDPDTASYNEVSVDEKFEKLFGRNSSKLIESPKTKSTLLDVTSRSHEDSIDEKFDELFHCEDLDVSIDRNMVKPNMDPNEPWVKNINTTLNVSVKNIKLNEFKPENNLHIAQDSDRNGHELHLSNNMQDEERYLHGAVLIDDGELQNSIKVARTSNTCVVSLSDILSDNTTESSIYDRMYDTNSPSKLHIIDVDKNSQNDAYEKLAKKDSLDSAYYSSQELYEDFCAAETSSSQHHEERREDFCDAETPPLHHHEVKRERKSTPMPLNEFTTSLYFNRESEIIPEEPENLSSDEEITRSSPVFNKKVGDMKDVVNNLEVTDEVDSIVYSKLHAPISTTPKTMKIIIDHKDFDAEFNATKTDRIKRSIDFTATNDIMYDNLHLVTEQAKHDLPYIPESSEQLSMLYKVQIETSSSPVTHGEQNRTIVPCSIIVSPAKPKRIFVEPSGQDIKYNSLESRAESDKVDNASSHGSDSGYTGSSNHLTNPTPPESLYMSPEPNAPNPKSNTLISSDFSCSMPVLNKTSMSDKNLTAYSTNSLRVDRSLEKHHDKKLRWSTLSICKKPYDIDDEVFSETLSPGHATLPRRSNSPLPHERDLDRDRFPINRSGLQARSESMASVYSGAGEGTRASVTVRGDVQFSLLYNYRLGALEVGVKRCRDLAAVDIKRNRSDPYVKVYLLPDKSKAGKRKTKVKKNTLNPVFEENLSFVQPLSSLSSRTLWLSVWHADMFGRNDFLGEVTLPLADVVFDDPAPQWHKLHERTEQFDEQHGSRGDLIVGLKFELQEGSGRGQTKGTLHVLVKEAKNLLATKPNGLADVFCKSYLLPERGRLAKQKTSVARRTLNPRWEHTFTYRGLTLQELSTRALELSLWDRDRLASNDFMGAIRLSLGTGTYMGASVNWMDSVGKEVSLWQTMMQRPNFWVEGSLPLRPQLSN